VLLPHTFDAAKYVFTQVFKTIYEQKPKGSELTSFSVLFAGYKGDIHYYVEITNGEVSLFLYLRKGERAYKLPLLVHVTIPSVFQCNTFL